MLGSFNKELAQAVLLCWKISMARSILGVRTHVSYLNSNTACANSLLKLPNTFGYAPSRLSI